MEITYADQRLSRLETEATDDGGLPAEAVGLFRRRMAQIRAARDARDLSALKSLTFAPMAAGALEHFSINMGPHLKLLLQLDATSPAPRVTVLAVEKTTNGGLQ